MRGVNFTLTSPLYSRYRRPSLRHDYYSLMPNIPKISPCRRDADLHFTSSLVNGSLDAPLTSLSAFRPYPPEIRTLYHIPLHTPRPSNITAHYTECSVPRTVHNCRSRFYRPSRLICFYVTVTSCLVFTECFVEIAVLR